MLWLHPWPLAQGYDPSARGAIISQCRCRSIGGICLLLCYNFLKLFLKWLLILFMDHIVDQRTEAREFMLEKHKVLLPLPLSPAHLAHVCLYCASIAKSIPRHLSLHKRCPLIRFVPTFWAEKSCQVCNYVITRNALGSSTERTITLHNFHSQVVLDRLPSDCTKG